MGKWEEDEGSRSRIVAGIAWQYGVGAQDNARFVVEKDRIFDGEDEEVAVGGECEVGVQVVAPGGEEGQVERALSGGALGDEFVGRSGLAADDDHLIAAGKDVVGGIPPRGGELRVVELHPVAGSGRRARRERADLFRAFGVATTLPQRAVGEELAGTAPCVGEDEERPHGVGLGVKHHGVRVAVNLEHLLQRLVAAAPIRKFDQSRPRVGPV